MLLAPLLATAVMATPPTPARVSAQSTEAVSSAPAAAPARQVMSWRWTDGSKSTERTFAKSKYHTVGRIPKFEVKIYPAYPPWKARLLFWVNGEWVARQQVRSDADGRMRMSFDPIGPTGTWEDVTWIVRVRLKDISVTRSATAGVPAQVEEILLKVRYQA